MFTDEPLQIRMAILQSVSECQCYESRWIVWIC